MLSECFITSTLAQPKSANTAIAKDLGIFLHELHPAHGVKSSYKKSSTPVNAIAANSSHIFAAQANKAVVHVYARERGNQEALISFPERIRSLALVGDGVLVLGTAEGRVILWEVCTGRQVATPAAHLQAVSCLAATNSHLLTGSEDSNIHVWSIPRLLAFSATATANETSEPLRSLSNHRAAVTNLVVGHGTNATNICVSASRDNTVVVWNYHSGELLRTFLLPSTPLCLALDPCDRVVYAGFEDGTIQTIELTNSHAALNPLFDASLQNTPVQVKASPRSAQSSPGATLSVGLSYDGTLLVTGHDSGKIIEWETCGPHSRELTDLNAPVTNVLMQSPFPPKRLTRAATVVKPKLGEAIYTFTAQLTGQLHGSTFEQAIKSPGLPSGMLEDAISRLSRRAGADAATSSSEDDKLRKENQDLWKMINDQQALQKKTWEKYTKLKSNES